MMAQTYRIGDLGKVISGYAFKSEEFTFEKQDNAIPVIKIKNIGNGNLNLDDISFVNKNFLELNSKYYVQKNDILISLTGSHVNQPNSVVGRVARCQYDRIFLLNQRAGKVIVEDDSNICDKDFLYYYLSIDEMKSKIINLAHGAANQANVSPKDIENIKIQLPNIIKQKKIAKIFRVYDNFIENNLKRIKLLEESSELIYKEWFMNFRFPGYEKCEFIDGMPKGWSKKKLKEVCKINMGQSPKSEFYNEDKIGLPFHQGVTDFGDRFPTNNKYCTVLKKLAESGDILFSVRAPVGRLNISTEKIIIGRGLAAIRNYKDFQSFQYYQLNNIFYKDNLIGGGTIFASITKNQLEDFEVMCPNEDVVNRFEKYANKIDKQIRNLFEYNRLLKEARDILIPKLINGEIEV